MTTSGTVTDYNISYPTGTTKFTITSLTTGPDGRLWYTLPANNAVYAKTVSSGAVTGGNVYFAHTLSSYPMNIISGPDGNLWFLEQGVTPKQIAKVTTSGSVSEYTLASGVYPGALAAGSDGAVWFVDGGTTRKLGRITGSGSVTEYTVPGTSVGNVNGLALGPDNALWFTYRDSGGPKVGRLGYF